MLNGILLAATLVLPQNPSPAEMTAASQLRYWTREITGSGVEAIDAEKIFLGRSFAEKLFPADLRKLEGTEGFAIRKRGKDLYLFGAKGCGTIFSVFEFLEANTDIIWPSAEAGIDRVFTPVKRIAVSAPDTLQIPSIAKRGFGHDMTARAHYFYLRHRCFQGEGQYPWIRFGMEEDDWGCHTYGSTLDWDEYKDTHPEFFCLIDGQRVRPGYSANLCFTAPGCAETFAREFIARRIEPYRPLSVYGIGIEDTGAFCECKGCRKPVRLANGKTLSWDEDPELYKSTLHWMWLNRVTAEICKKYPNVRIAGIAYIFTLRPPPIKLHPNIDITYAPSSKNMREDYTGPSNVRWLEALRGWGKRTKNLNFFEYWGDAAEYPKPVAEVVARDLRHDLDANTTRIWSEWTMRGDAAYVSAIEFWTTARLMWDVNRDPDALRDEFCRKTFRGAAPAMKKFYSVVRDAWFKQPGISMYSDNPITATEFLIRDPAREKAAFSALSNAVAAADHPVSKKFAERILSVMESYAAKARELAGKKRGIVLPLPDMAETLPSSEGIAWGQALEIPPDAFTVFCPATNACPPALAPEMRLAHDGSNVWLRIRAPLETPSAQICFQAAAQEHELWHSLSLDSSGEQSSRMAWKRKSKSPAKATVSKWSDRWEAIVCLPFDKSKLRNNEVRLATVLFPQDGYSPVSWLGARPNNPKLFVRARLAGKGE